MSPVPYRILLIDDSAPFRRHVGGALESSGLTVVEAGDGVEALWRARSEGAFDLVLVDIHMPNLDGLSLIREVRKLPGYAEVPIIVITSDGSRDRRQEGRRAGATAWLLKPPDLPGLINSVHAALMRVMKPDATSVASQRPSTLGSRHPSTAAPDSRGSLPPRTKPPAARSEQPPLRPQRSLPPAAPPLARRARSAPARDTALAARSGRTGSPSLSSPPSLAPDKRAPPARARALPEPRPHASGAARRGIQEPRSPPAGTRAPSTQPAASAVDTRAPSTAPQLPGTRTPSTEPRSAVAEARLQSSAPRNPPAQPRPASKGTGQSSED
jgi:two-component system chemotaxis response regulator CheY